MADEPEVKPETFTIKDPSGTGNLELSRERLIELATAGAASSRRMEEINTLAERNRRKAEELRELEGLQNILSKDPAKAVKIVAELAQERSGGTLDLTPEELGLIEDGETEGASGAAGRAIARRLEQIERSQRETALSSQQSRQDAELRAALDDYPDIKATEKGRSVFTTLVRAIGASGSNADIRDIAETVANSMRGFVLEAAEVKLKERERHAQDASMRTGGPPTLTPPEKPFTVEGMKKGDLRKHALNVAEKMRLAARGGGV
jgi:hypothetical protein